MSDYPLSLSPNQLERAVASGEIVKVPLSRGMFAIIDACDAESVLALNWCVMPVPNKEQIIFYALHRLSTEFGRKSLLLHRFILDPPPGMIVDHRNGDGLDCRRCNMREATRSQNQANRRKSDGSASQYKGVYLVRDGWQAVVVKDHRAYRSEVREAEIDAARDYDRMALELFGEFANGNFIGPRPLIVSKGDRAQNLK